MTIMHRPADARGHRRLDWLDSYHSFSYAHYLDAAHMNFRSLRVLNDETLAPGASFPPQGHRDMEIVTYVVAGTLAYGDESCIAGTLKRGDVRLLSAGAGLRERQFNAQVAAPLRLLQMWFLPMASDAARHCQCLHVAETEKHNRLALLAGPGALPIRQDAQIFASHLATGARLQHRLGAGRGAWIQIVAGHLRVNGIRLQAGDGLAVEQTPMVAIEARVDTEFLLIDLA